ncbi:MAG TPA: hypothetical protein VHE37_05225, partial [Nevskiaceae bacterium]|nr:hypothetical protein [Nevskiaceae bacterium]
MSPMYNLLVTLVPRAWERTAFVLERERVLEYSDAPLQKKFRALSARAAGQLLQLPCLFAYEQQVGADARLGHITRIQRRRNDVRMEFRIDRASPPVPRELLDKSRSDFDIAAGELSRTHWAVKDVALLEMLEARGLLAARERRRLQRALQADADAVQVRR